MLTLLVFPHAVYLLTEGPALFFAVIGALAGDEGSPLTWLVGREVAPCGGAVMPYLDA